MKRTGQSTPALWESTQVLVNGEAVPATWNPNALEFHALVPGSRRLQIQLPVDFPIGDVVVIVRFVGEPPVG